ncbi:hypothetical protein EDC01DRAFT_635289 [Geopyxis carbonaria]|nr:hypothetical protein EDC01DRAFT_635289 [Geopyxis carbonaria]
MSFSKVCNIVSQMRVLFKDTPPSAGTDALPVSGPVVASAHADSPSFPSPAGCTEDSHASSLPVACTDDGVTNPSSVVASAHQASPSFPSPAGCTEDIHASSLPVACTDDGVMNPSSVVASAHQASPSFPSPAGCTEDSHASPSLIYSTDDGVMHRSFHEPLSTCRLSLDKISSPSFAAPLLSVPTAVGTYLNSLPSFPSLSSLSPLSFVRHAVESEQTSPSMLEYLDAVPVLGRSLALPRFPNMQNFQEFFAEGFSLHSSVSLVDVHSTTSEESSSHMGESLEAVPLPGRTLTLAPFPNMQNFQCWFAEGFSQHALSSRALRSQSDCQLIPLGMVCYPYGLTVNRRPAITMSTLVESSFTMHGISKGASSFGPMNMPGTVFTDCLGSLIRGLRHSAWEEQVSVNAVRPLTDELLPVSNVSRIERAQHEGQLRAKDQYIAELQHDIARLRQDIAEQARMSIDLVKKLSIKSFFAQKLTHLALRIRHVVCRSISGMWIAK